MRHTQSLGLRSLISVLSIVAWSALARAETQPAHREPSGKPSGESRGVVTTPAPTVRNYALLVGVDHYDHWPRLANPLIDVSAIGEALQTGYGFQVQILENVTRRELLTSLRSLAEREYQAGDQILIMFAGHGTFDPLSKTGYLVTRETQAPEEDPTYETYLSYPLLLSQITGIPCQHILLVADACFAGTLDRRIAMSRGEDPYYADTPRAEFVRRKMQYRTRLYLTSGGKEYVRDGRPGSHSPFVRRFLEGLRGYGGTDGILTLEELVANYLDRVEPQPRFDEFADNEPGSSFLFVPSKEPESAAAPPPSREAELRPESPPCYSIETKYAEVFPFSLKNLVQLQSGLSVFRLRVQNKCLDPLHLAVLFKVRQGPAVIPQDMPEAEYTVYPGRSFDQAVDPGLEFLATDVEGSVEVIWRIRNEAGVVLQTGTARTELLPKDVVCWDLVPANGDSVKHEVILASLAAWTWSADASVKTLTNTLLGKVGKGNGQERFVQKWFRACYDEFHHAGGVQVQSQLDAFPPRRRQRVLTPVQVLGAGQCDPLEASLLVGSLSRSISRSLRARLVLLALDRGEVQSGEEDYFLAWSREASGAWSAIDLSKSGSMGFDDNREAATQRLTKLLKDRPAILQNLDSRGVFISDNWSVVALDFAAASKWFDIRGLP